MPAILDLVDETEAVELYKQLIRIPSEYADGVVADHERIARFLESHLRELGLSVDYYVPPKDGQDFPIIIARARGEDRERSLCFFGHYNTVPVGDRTKWTKDPFGAEVEGDRVYGRGAADMKNGIASVIAALAAFLRLNQRPKGDIACMFVPGEGAQFRSVTQLIQERSDLARADIYLDADVGAPFSIVLMSGGIVWVKLTVRGKEGHTGLFRTDGSQPRNAIVKMARILSRVVDVDQWMRYEEHRLFGPPTRYSKKPIVEVGVISGGRTVNVVPDECTALIDIRMLPGQIPEGLLGELHALVRSEIEEHLGFSYDIDLVSTQDVAGEFEEHDVFVKQLQEAVRVVAGQEVRFIGGIGS